jgi:hypothetical protein
MIDNLTYCSSNVKKIEDVNRLFPNISTKLSVDLPEIIDSAFNTILYKTLLSNENEIIEDASVEIDGKLIIDIKWKLETITHEQPGVWYVYLGVKRNNKIYIYKAEQTGVFKAPNKENINSEQVVFAFDTYFKPDGSVETFHDLKLKGLSDKFNVRKMALDNLFNNIYVDVIEIDDIISDTKPLIWQNGYRFLDFIITNQNYSIEEKIYNNLIIR